MSMRPVDAMAADTYAPPATVAAYPAFGSSSPSPSQSDGDSDADLIDTTSRRGLGPTLLFWAAFTVIATAFAAMAVADFESARAPGTRWWLIWLIAAHHGVTFTLSLCVIFVVTERFQRVLRDVQLHAELPA